MVPLVGVDKFFVGLINSSIKESIKKNVIAAPNKMDPKDLTSRHRNSSKWSRNGIEFLFLFMGFLQQGSRNFVGRSLGGVQMIDGYFKMI